MPGVSYMMRQAAGHDEDRIDADRVARPGVARRQRLGGAGDAAQPPVVERERRRLLAGARLHLDEGERAATPRDDIDLAHRRARPHCQNPPAPEPEPPGGPPLGAPAAAFGPMPRPANLAMVVAEPFHPRKCCRSNDTCVLPRE